jgi:F-type H+-transporting ATPase subunit b
MLNLNLTLFGQMLTFIIFVWFTMRYVWPPITQAMKERQEKIADGLAASERGKQELELAQFKAAEQVRDAKIQAAQIIESANKKASILLDEAKEKIRTEGERLINLSKAEAEKEFLKAKQELKTHVAMIAMAGAEKILGHHIDEATNSELIQKLITEI